MSCLLSLLTQPDKMVAQPAREEGEEATIPRPLQINVLQRLLAENRQFGPVLRGGGICNHYSMALLAAWKLGAGDVELAKFHHYLDGRYRLSWDEIPLAQRLSRESWAKKEGMGDMNAVAEFRAFFVAEAGTMGLDAMLRSYLPRLVLGQHKGLFHPIIRLSFALLSPGSCAEEAAEAMAYSSSRHEPLYSCAPQDFAGALEPDAQADASGPAADLTELEGQMHVAWEQLRLMYASRGYDGRGSSFQVLAKLYQDENLRALCLSHFPVSAETAEESVLLAVQLALQLYKAQPSLITLHAVTGGHAVSDLLPRLHPAARIVSAKLYWVWLSTLFVEKGAPPVSLWEQSKQDAFGDRNQAAEATWPEVRRQALSPIDGEAQAGAAGLGDQEPQTHCIKMAYTCDAMCTKKEHALYLEIAGKVASSGRPW
mmetsp:Transcript_18299/g.29231  ORF Transcript_18299/g.29231 Transcript_18299/m.29231 type:complete len:427 (-) Transcript_18299:343-1623(-)